MTVAGLTGMTAERGAAASASPPHRRRRRKRLVNRRPGRAAALALAFLPFALIVAAYVWASSVRLAANPLDTLTPSLGEMAGTFAEMAFSEDQRTGEVVVWSDTGASLLRLAIGMAISFAAALALGIAIGFLPLVRAGLAPVVAAISLIPPIAVLPILFLAFGLGETAKVALIVVGTAPIMVRAVARSVSEIPEEQVVKAETLGATTWQMITRLVLPQALPPLLVATRLALGPAWIFLISAEAISANTGLGYRIFQARRYAAMDVILPYVAWITALAYALDFALRNASTRLFRWAHFKGAGM